MSQPDKQDVIRRLRRIEGQIKGIQKMVEEEQDCTAVLTQIAAVRSAVSKVGAVVLERYSKTCVAQAENEADREKAVGDLLETVQKFLNFVD